MGIALAVDVEVDQSVADDLVEHVIEEGTPVSSRFCPLPSRSMRTEIFVSRVLR